MNISNSIRTSPKVQSNRKPSQRTSISYITNLNLILRSFWQWRNMMQHYLKMSSPCWHKSYIGGTTKGHDAQFVNQFVYLQGVLEKSTFLKFQVYKSIWLFWTTLDPSKGLYWAIWIIWTVMDCWAISYNFVCLVGPKLSHGFVNPKFQKGTFFCDTLWPVCTTREVRHRLEVI